MHGTAYFKEYRVSMPAIRDKLHQNPIFFPERAQKTEKSDCNRITIYTANNKYTKMGAR